MKRGEYFIIFDRNLKNKIKTHSKYNKIYDDDTMQLFFFLLQRRLAPYGIDSIKKERCINGLFSNLTYTKCLMSQTTLSSFIL